MSQAEPALADAEEMNRQIWRGLRKFTERITPWLYEAGILIFGSLMALNLLVEAALFTIGPVDFVIKVATAAFAFALPLDVTGLVALRLIQEMKDAHFEDEMIRAFREEGFVSNQMPAPAVLEKMRKQRTGIVLSLAAGIFALAITLTLIGLTATFWHMAWWIAIGFCVMILLNLSLVSLAIANVASPDQANRSGG